MGGGASTKPTIEKSNSVSGIPGCTSNGNKGKLKREKEDYFLYWSDLESTGITAADAPLGELEHAVRAVVEANNSVLDATWRVQDELCNQYNICVFSIEQDAASIKPVVKKRNRYLEETEIRAMISSHINHGDGANHFKTNWEKFADTLKKTNSFMTADYPGSNIEIKNGHSVVIKKDNGKVILVNEMQQLNYTSYLLSRQLVTDSVEENVSKVGYLMKPMLDTLKQLKDAGSFKIFRVVMSFFQEGQSIDGCVNFTVEPDPLSPSAPTSMKNAIKEYEDVYRSCFGPGGLFPVLNRALALMRAALQPLLAIPKKTIDLQKTNWLGLAKEEGVSKSEFDKLPRKIAGNINKLKTVNVMTPACAAFISTVFTDLHTAMRTAELLPTPDSVDELPAVVTTYDEPEVEWKHAAKAQRDAEGCSSGDAAVAAVSAGVAAGILGGVAAAAVVEAETPAPQAGFTAASADECEEEEEDEAPAPQAAPVVVEASPVVEVETPASPAVVVESVVATPINISAQVAAAAEEEDSDEGA